MLIFLKKHHLSCYSPNNNLLLWKSIFKVKYLLCWISQKKQYVIMLYEHLTANAIFTEINFVS